VARMVKFPGRVLAEAERKSLELEDTGPNEEEDLSGLSHEGEKKS